MLINSSFVKSQRKTQSLEKLYLFDCTVQSTSFNVNKIERDLQF